MRYILTKLRRGRRRNRIPYGLLVSAVLLSVFLAVSLLVLPASARMPKTSDGRVTDGDGIIDSDGVAGDVPPVTDLIPGMSTDAESGVKDPVTTERVTDPVTETTARVTEGVTTRPVTSEVGGAGNTASGISPWVIAFLIFAVIVAAVVVVIWWTMGRERRG